MNHRGILFTILVILLAFSSSAQEPTESDLTVPSIPAGTSDGTEESATPVDTSSEPTDTDRTYQLPEGLSPEAAFLARLSGLFRVEDPASLYSFEIRDREVEFFLDGTWESSLTGVLAINFSTDGDTISFSPPVFEQQVDLSTWLFLDQTWYFEATFAEEFTRNTVAAGYVGDDETVVKHVRIGNSGIIFPDTYPFITAGGGDILSPGIMGTFGGDSWKADAMVRYDTAVQREMVLSGMNEVTDEFIPLETPVLGKWFVLPSSRITGTVSVYIEDENGPLRDDSARVKNRRWRKLNPAEFTIHGIEGILELEFDTTSTVAVVYDGAWSAGGTAGDELTDFISETRAWFESSTQALPEEYLPDPDDPSYRDDCAERYILGVDGNESLVVQERGYFSPFSLASRYRSYGTRLEIIHRETEKLVDIVAVQEFGTEFAEVFRTDGNAPSNGSSRYRSPSSRFPLAPEQPLMYLPAGGGRNTDTSLVIRSRTHTPIGTISLGENAIPGTIQIVRNGITDNSFTYDESSSLLTLVRPPQTGETIRITWMDSETSARNATLTMAAGIAWNATDRLDFSLASALSWNLSDDGYTDASESSPGSFVVSAGTVWTGETITAETAFALDLSTHDTTGFYRIFGMDGSPVLLHPPEDWYVPPPAQTEPVLGLPAFGGPSSLFPLSETLDRDNRVPLANTEDEQLPSHSGSTYGGAVLVMSATHTLVNQWSAADILSGTEGGYDLRGVASLSLMIRNPGTRDDFDLFLQLGTRIDDYYDDPGTIRTWKLDTPPAGSSWRSETIELTDEDRRALGAGQNIRLIARPRDGITSVPATVVPLSFTIETSRIELREAPFTAAAQPEYSGSGRLSVEEADDPVSLRSFDRPVVDRFNPGSVNRVLALGFTPENSTESIRLYRYMGELFLEQYQSLVFYFYADTLPPPGAEITLTLSSPSGLANNGKRALEAVLDTAVLSEQTWHKVRIDLDTATMYLDDEQLPSSQGRVQIPNRDGNPARADIILSGWAPGTNPPDSSGGTRSAPQYMVYLDEFHLEGTDMQVAGRNKTAFTWDRPGVLASAGGIPLVSDAALSLTADSAAGKTTSSAAGTAEASVTLFTVKTTGTMTASTETARLADSAGYSVEIPMYVLNMRESCFADFSGNAFRRDTGFSLSGPVPFKVESMLDFSGRTLYRSISATMNPGLGTASAGSFSLSLENSFDQSGLPERTDIGDTGWQQLWTDMLEYMVSPGEQDAAERNGTFSFNFDWNTPFGKAPETDPESDSGQKSSSGTALSAVRLSGKAAAAYRATAVIVHTSTAEAVLSFPIRIAGTTLIPSWTRKSGGERPVSAGGDYAEDTKNLFSDLGDMEYFLSVAPFQDLFMEDLDRIIRDDELENSRYFMNNYRLSWQRQGGGQLADLWIPRSVETAVSRTTATSATADNRQDVWESSIQASFTALNLAGTFGILPIFSWYEQDEISQLYRWSSSWGTGFFTWSIDTWHSLLLFFTDGGTVSLQNGFHYDSPAISGSGELYRNTIMGIWKRPIASSFLSDVLMRVTTLPLSARREDNLQCTVTLDEDLSFTLDYKHTLAVGIGKNGEVSLTGGTAYSRFRNGNALLELTLGVGGKLMY